MERERRLPAGTDDPNAIYDEHYYRAGLGPFPYLRDERWLGFFASVADNLVRIFAPRTAFDAGCAMGMLVESLWDRGVAAQGIDVSAYALSCVRPDMRAHCRYGSIADGVEGRFDIVTCIEVLEHLPPETTAVAVANLCRLSDTIVFSSSPGDFDEPTHVNVRPPLEWVRLFARNGFRADLTVEANFIAPHALVFRRADRYDDGEIEAFVARQAALRTALGERDKELAELRAAHEIALAQTREREAQAEAGEAKSEAVLAQLTAVETQLKSLETQLKAVEAKRDAAQRELGAMRVALDAARAAAGAAAQRDAESRAVLLAAQTERDASAARLERAEREHVRVLAKLGTLRRELADAEESLLAERDRTASERVRAAQLADELERQRNARLLDGMQRTDDAAELQRLRALEQRYARLAAAYAERFG